MDRGNYHRQFGDIYITDDVVHYNQRSRIIKMGWLVKGTVLDIEERRGFKGYKYIMSVIKYHHHLAGKATVEVFSAKRRRTNKKGNVVSLYYNPGKLTHIVLQNDNLSKVSIIELTVAAILVLTARIFV